MAYWFLLMPSDLSFSFRKVPTSSGICRFISECRFITSSLVRFPDGFIGRPISTSEVKFINNRAPLIDFILGFWDIPAFKQKCGVGRSCPACIVLPEGPPCCIPPSPLKPPNRLSSFYSVLMPQFCFLMTMTQFFFPFFYDPHLYRTSSTSTPIANNNTRITAKAAPVTFLRG